MTETTTNALLNVPNQINGISAIVICDISVSLSSIRKFVICCESLNRLFSLVDFEKKKKSAKNTGTYLQTEFDWLRHGWVIAPAISCGM